MLATLVWNSPGPPIETSSRTSPVWWRFRKRSVVFPGGCAVLRRQPTPAALHRHQGAHPAAKLTAAVTWFTGASELSGVEGRRKGAGAL